MILCMVDDRQRVAQMVKAAMGWRGLSSGRIEATGRVSRATLDRVKRGDPNVSETMLRALGDVLGLPRDFLLYVGAGDVEQVRASGADDDLVRWTLGLIQSTSERDDGERATG